MKGRPARLGWWPEGTTVRSDDIVVSGTSLRHLAEVCGTPAAHGGASDGRATETGRPTTRTGVLVVRVVAMARHRSGFRVVQVDARLDDLRLVWAEARRIGGAGDHRDRPVLIVRRPSRVDIADADDVISVSLPTDLRVGDLLAIPSRPLRADPAHPLHPVTGRPDGTPESIFDFAKADA